MTAKNNAERQREFRQRKADTEATEVRGIFAPPKDHQQIKAKCKPGDDMTTPDLPPLPEPYLSAFACRSLLGPNVEEPLFTSDQMRAYAAAAVLTEQKDAARYRWLRDVGDESWEPMAKRGISAIQIDAAIDAAIRAEPKENFNV